MSKEQQAVPYTPGELVHGRTGPTMEDYKQPFGVCQPESHTLVAGCFGDIAGGHELAKGNSRAIAAFWNSYARLGPDAVRLAEADLLGQALEALQKIAALDAPPDCESIKYFQVHLYHEAVAISRAILAQLPEQP